MYESAVKARPAGAKRRESAKVGPSALERDASGLNPNEQSQIAFRQALDHSPRVVTQARLAAVLARAGTGGAAQGTVVQRVGKGLAEAKTTLGYALALKEKLSATEHEERLDLLRATINTALSEAGVPPVTITLSSGKGFAEFRPETWGMEILSDTLSSDDPRLLGEVVGTVYHEARHAEQYFRVAQMYAANGNDIELFALKLRKDIKDEAAESKGQLSEASEDLMKKTGSWAKSLQNPRAILDPMEKAEFALAVQVDNFKKTAGALIQVAFSLAESLQKKELTEIDPEPLLKALDEYRSQDLLVLSAQREVSEWMVKYRKMPHELDAHQLGWLAQDIFGTGEKRDLYDPEYESRLPKEAKIWKLLGLISQGVEDLATLALTIKAPSTGVEEEEEELGELELSPEEEAHFFALKKTNKEKGDPEYKRAYEEALSFYRQEALKPKTPKALTTKGDVLRRLHEINTNLKHWEIVEKDYLNAISALVHRRTVI